MQLHNHIRRAIDSIRQGTIGPALLDIFFPIGIPVPKECALWDYKTSFEAEKAAYAELVKDILSFFNSYGGYLFLGVCEFVKDEHFAVVGFHRPPNFLANLRGAIDSYSSVQIDIAIADLTISDQNVTAILIPCRPNSQPPAFLTKNGPEKKSGRPIFTEKATYFRQFDKTLPASIASQWEFLNSSRNPDELLAWDVPLSPPANLSRVVRNNLPDKNLICSHLFGREEILASLWAWIADELEPVRLLAGAGGKGKTSIACEFASHFFRHAPFPFEQVLWVLQSGNNPLSAAALDLDGDGQAPVARRGDLGLAGLFDAGQAHAATSSGTAGPHLTITSLKRRLTRISPWCGSDSRGCSRSTRSHGS